jgi:hypothetical protein
VEDVVCDVVVEVVCDVLDSEDEKVDVVNVVVKELL